MVVLALRIGFSLLVVLALMWGLAKVARRPLARRGGAGGLTVVARHQLSRSASVAVLNVAGRGMLLGITEHQVSLLGETDLAELERLGEPARRSPVRLDGGLEAGTDAGATGAGLAGKLAGSVLSPRTWSQTVDFLRDRTARKP